MLSADGKHRFPRLKEGDHLRFPRLKKRAKNGEGARFRHAREKIERGELPKGWHHLTKRQKRLARRVASGMSIKEACKRVGVGDEKTFYLWKNLHPLFGEYFHRYAHKYASRITERIDARLPRAVQVVEESMESGDPYFRHEAATTLLKGRGVYRTSSNVSGEVVQRHSLEGNVNVKHSHKHDKETVDLLVAALRGKAVGDGKKIQPKIITVEAVKELPPAQGLDATPAKIQDSRQKEVA